jgi:hypothetical protein
VPLGSQNLRTQRSKRCTQLHHFADAKTEAQRETEKELKAMEKSARHSR